MLPGSGDCLHGLFVQIDAPDQVVERVRHVEHVASDCQALRVIEAGHGVIAVLAALLSATDDL